MEIKLRCLAVKSKSHFFVGDVCKVVAVSTKDNRTGVITIINTDGRKIIDRFKFSKNKKLLAGDSMFQLMIIPNTEVKQ